MQEPTKNTYDNRFEYKYIITVQQRDKMISEIKPFVTLDRHTENSDVGYRVKSIYFESDDFSSYFEKIDGERDRIKLRLRSYGKDYDRCSLELKIKKSSNVSKRKIIMGFTTAMKTVRSLTTGDFEVLSKFNEQDKKVLLQVKRLLVGRHLKPKVLISYNRLAYESAIDQRLRISFDSCLRGQHSELTLESRMKGKFLLPPSMCVMELKFNSVLPQWAATVIQSNNCSVNKISKFCHGMELLYSHALQW